MRWAWPRSHMWRGWSRCEASPERGVDDLVEQVVVQGGGGRQAQELHGERGDQAQRDASGAEGDEDLQGEPVLTDGRVTQTDRQAVGLRPQALQN